MANASSAVLSTDAVVHTQYNNLRLDGIGPYDAERVWNDNEHAKFGTLGADGDIYSDGTNLFIDSPSGGNLNLQVAGTTRLQVTATGFNLAGDMLFDDNEKVTLGTGEDAFIKYDGTNLVVDPKAVGSGVVSVLGGVTLEASASLSVGTDAILSDSSGTMTLSNIDALDAATEATIEAAIDTLANLTAASSLATVGTISTGVWQGDAVASAYLGSHTHTESQISNLGTAIALVADNLSVFAATTSAQLRGVISNETGTGSLVFATSPTLVTPALGTPASGVATNLTGTASSLTAGNVTTNANLTGHVTSVGNAAVLGSFTKAQLDAAVSDGNVTYDGEITIYTDSEAVAAVESAGLSTPALGTPTALVGTNITGTAANLTAGAVTTNANLTGHVTSTGNAAVLGSFTMAQLDTAVSDGNILYDGDITVFTTANAIAAVEGESTLVLQSGATIGGSVATTVASKLSVFAATTSAELAGVISNETGSGSLVFATSPTLVTPALGTPASGVMTNATGTAASLTAGNVTTNANLTGHVTSTGNAAVLGAFTKAQLSSAVSDGTPLYSGDIAAGASEGFVTAMAIAL